MACSAALSPSSEARQCSMILALVWASPSIVSLLKSGGWARFTSIQAWSRERLAADICLAVGDEPGECLVQGVERAVPRRVVEYFLGAGDARGDAAEGVLAGGLGVLGGDPAVEFFPVDEVQHRLMAEPPGDAGRQATQRHRLLGDHVEAGPD